MIFTEVIKVKDGRFCNLGAHLGRLLRTVQHFFGCDIDLSLVNENTIPLDLRDGVVKCRIVYDKRIVSVNFERYNYPKIKTMALVYHDQIDYSYKFKDRSALNDLLAQRGNADEVLIVKNGLITDTSFTNVVFRHSNGALFTPESCLLAGTKRQLLLNNGIISQRRITVHDISQYCEIYLINAMIDIEDQIITEIR